MTTTTNSNITAISTNRPILLNGKHDAELTAHLDAVQNRCTTRTITVQDIYSTLAEVEKNLAIPRCHLKGVTVYFSGAQHFPHSYRFVPISTHFKAIHNGRCWMLCGLSRHTCPNRQSNVQIEIPEATRNALIDRFTMMTIK